MPYQRALPTWLALNNGNFNSPAPMTDQYTGQGMYGGGLNLGDYFDITNDEAAQASYATNGILYGGRYRFVQVDSGATAANVKTGTVGYARSGSSVKSVQIVTVGSAQTNGTFQISAAPGNGGGTGAVISVTIASGAISSVSVVNGGVGYVSPPTFTVSEGGSAGTVVAQLGYSANIVTSADQALSSNAAAAADGPVRPVVFLNSITPGNYGFVQELGVATVIATATDGQTQGQFAIVDSTNKNGCMQASATTLTIYAIGQVIDPLTSPLANTPFKILMGYAATTVQE